MESDLNNLATLAALSDLTPSEYEMLKKQSKTFGNQQHYVENHQQSSPPPSPAVVNQHDYDFSLSNPAVQKHTSGNLKLPIQSYSINGQTLGSNMPLSQQSLSTAIYQQGLALQAKKTSNQQHEQMFYVVTPPSTSNQNQQAVINPISIQQDNEAFTDDYYDPTDEINRSEDNFVSESRRILASAKVGKAKAKASKRRTSSKVSDTTNSVDVDLEALIEQIRQYPCIWNVKLSSNKDLEKRKNAWAAIQQNVDNGMHSDDYLKKLWKYLRDSFKRCIENREAATRSGAAASQLKECRFFYQLQFLKDVVTPLPCETNIDVDVEVDNDEESQVPVKRKVVNNKNKTSKKGQDKSPGDAIDLMLIKTLQNIDSTEKNKNSGNGYGENDPDVLFCRSLIQRLKDLPQKKNHLARLKIEEIFFNIEYED